MYQAKECTLTFPNMQMDYITFGTGTKTLIMIQGLNTRSIKGMAKSLSYMYRIFAKDYRVYLFDRKKDIKKDITVRELAEDIAMAMDSLKLSHAYILGVSQGGMIAQYLAINRPDLVHKLVLAVTLSRNNDTVQTVIQNWITLTEQGCMKELVKDMAIKLYSETYIRRYQLFLPLLTILQKPKDIHRFIRLTKSCLTCNTYEELKKIQCPVLVIGGKQDHIVTGKSSEEIAKKLGCKIYMYENFGHAVYEEAKDFNKKVYEFFEE